MPLLLGMPSGRTRYVAPKSVTRVMQEHHQLLDELLALTRVAAENESFAQARQTLAWFRIEIDKHIRVEEQLLFPLLERATGSSGGSTSLRRAEHRHINAALDRIDLALAEGVDIDEEIIELMALLRAHDLKEEQMLHPLSERMVADDQQEALFEGANRLLDSPLPD